MCNKNTLSSIMHTVTQKAKEIFADKLNSVILYGSYARNDFDEESDIDVMILADIPCESVSYYEDLFSDFSLNIDLENNIILSLIIQDKKTFDKWKNSSAFFKNIISEGIDYVA